MAKLIGPLILTFILACPCVAEAECAWVLWMNMTKLHERRVMSAHSKFEECHAALAMVVEGMKKQHNAEGLVLLPPGSGWFERPAQGRVYLNCFPDTVDPRGPKGGGQ